MSDARYLRYLGEGKDAWSQLAALFEEHTVEWQTFASVDDLLDDCHRSTLGHADGQWTGDWCSLEQAYAPVILDFSHAAEAAWVLRELKMINRGIPVIILCDQASLTSFSLALLDGSEALFHKPLASPEQVWQAVERAQRRVARWMTAMESAQSCSF